MSRNNSVILPPKRDSKINSSDSNLAASMGDQWSLRQPAVKTNTLKKEDLVNAFVERDRVVEQIASDSKKEEQGAESNLTTAGSNTEADRASVLISCGDFWTASVPSTAPSTAPSTQPSSRQGSLVAMPAEAKKITKSLKKALRLNEFVAQQLKDFKNIEKEEDNQSIASVDLRLLQDEDDSIEFGFELGLNLSEDSNTEDLPTPKQNLSGEGAATPKRDSLSFNLSSGK